MGSIDAHRGGGKGGEEGMKQHPPRQIFEKLVNKNAIKCKIGGLLAKTSSTPPPWIFNRCASMMGSLWDREKLIPITDDSNKGMN